MKQKLYNHYMITLLAMVVVTLFSTCKGDDENHCPPIKIIKYDAFPEEVLAFNPFRQIDSMTFINESLDSIQFILESKSENKLLRFAKNPIECFEDPELFVTIYFDAVVSTYTYISEEGDSLILRYHPFLHERSEGYSNTFENWVEVVIMIDFRLTTLDDKIFTSAFFYTEVPYFLPWEPSDIPYEHYGYSYSEVYDYITTNSAMVYFNKTNGVVGFLQDNGTSWILAN